MITPEQQAICDRFGVIPAEAPPDLKLGITTDIASALPLNGLRHPPDRDITGWYIWSGETFPDAADAFAPLHISHLATHCPAVIPYLALPPGYRFLVTPGQEDIWYDPSLLIT
ncbi:immunity protein Imm33 domain-containing protein [Kribbella monticola]|uniref:immunity protein Imm33 domain-containing protein n=1 Tax=Kribbella monticola TaxID=2185285 RepID=UPI001E335D2F|nr:hypothetical protein [Kribbella monticola]